MSNGEHCSLVERRLFGSSLSNNELVLPQGVESEIGTKIGPGALLGPEGLSNQYLWTFTHHEPLG